MSSRTVAMRLCVLCGSTSSKKKWNHKLQQIFKFFSYTKKSVAVEQEYCEKAESAHYDRCPLGGVCISMERMNQ